IVPVMEGTRTDGELALRQRSPEVADVTDGGVQGSRGWRAAGPLGIGVPVRDLPISIVAEVCGLPGAIRLARDARQPSGHIVERWRMGIQAPRATLGEVGVQPH